MARFLKAYINAVDTITVYVNSASNPKKELLIRLNYLADTKQQGSKVKTQLINLELARKEKGLMSSKNLSYTIQSTNEDYDINKSIVVAIENNAKDYLNPPIKNNRL